MGDHFPNGLTKTEANKQNISVTRMGDHLPNGLTKTEANKQKTCCGEPVLY